MSIRIETIEERIEHLLEAYDIVEIFYESGLTPEEVIEILVRGGHMELPENEPI